MDKERMATDIVRFVRLFLTEWRIIPMKNESDVVFYGSYLDIESDLNKWDPPEGFGTLKSRRDLWILGVNIHEMYTEIVLTIVFCENIWSKNATVFRHSRLCFAVSQRTARS